MNKKNNNKSVGYLISFTLHVVILVIMFFIKYEIDYPMKEFVEIGFGGSGLSGSAGAPGSEIEEFEKVTQDADKSASTVSEKEVKEVDLAKTKNTFEDNNVRPVEKSKEKTTNTKNVTNERTADRTSVSKGNQTTGEGSFGYDIDWGGGGTRKIYNYELPRYPDGVQKEIDIRLRFSILPDGTVGTVFPLTKADTRLEEAAMNSLRRWKFQPLSKNQNQVEQSAVIVFPYRLR